MKYKVGDAIYVSCFGRREIKMECPVCFGKCVVRLILGNDDSVEMPCEYCRRGYEPAVGYVKEYRMDAGVEMVVIDQISTEHTAAGEKVEYRTDSYIYHPKDAFSTEEEALAESNRRADAYNLEQETKAELVKGKPNKNYSWNAGYHMRQVKEAKEKVEYHSKMAKICKARAGSEQ